MISLTLYLFGVLITLAACGMAAWNDVRAFRIPNLCSLLAILGFLAAWTGVALLSAAGVGGGVPLLGSLSSHLISAGGVFFVTLLLFMSGAVGAGDAKFLSALSLWVPLSGLAAFVFYMSLFGGLMGLATLVLRCWKPFAAPPEGTWLAAAQAGQNRIPYGVAISLGFVAVFLFLGYFDITEITKRVSESV